VWERECLGIAPDPYNKASRPVGVCGKSLWSSVSKAINLKRLESETRWDDNLPTMKNFLTTAIATAFLLMCGPSRAEREVFGAVLKGNISAVKQHMDNGANVNSKERTGVNFIALRR
jgi:hypothetical protein